MIHGTAEVHPAARVAATARIWNWVQIREGAVIGENTIISKGVYVDFDVHIGDNVKIQNDVSVFHGVTIERGVFVGPHACFTNDNKPRAINPDGSLKGAEGWVVSPTLLREGCSIGANATITPGLTIGRFAMVGAGAVVTHDVPDYGLVVGCPARLIGHVCLCGERLPEVAGRVRTCAACGRLVTLGE
jgi:UDP-2-acetamido-3-amino-2,3-dideoxy-glucuronate N-acetyltransferase